MDRDGGFSSFCGVSALGSSPLFPHPAPRTSPRSPRSRKQVTRQIAVCQGTGRRWGCSVSSIGVSLMLSPMRRLALHRGGACVVDDHCLPGGFDTWRRDNGSRRGRFIVLRCVRPRIITAVSTPPPCSLPHAHHNSQATRQIALCRGTGKR